MISIIICSKYSQTDFKLLQNIQDTIGVDYEIVHIDNSQHKYSILQAYNLGVERAKGEYLCFMHEDVVFHSHDWGNVVEFTLADDIVGAIGVAGGNVQLTDVDWRFCYETNHPYLIQGVYTIEENPKYYFAATPKESKEREPLWQVVTLDGLWFCIRKELFRHIRFDEENFHDFHLYDSDICMQINKLGKGVFITHDILMEHKSIGLFTESYRESLHVFFKKWKDDLPMIRGLYVSAQDIEYLLSYAPKDFEERLSHDIKIRELNRVIALKKEGLPCRNYTDEEIALMDESAYKYRHKCIKDKQIPTSYVKDLVDEYRHSSFARRKFKLYYKYVWYRVIKRIGK